MNTHSSIALVVDSAHFAAERHIDQRRKDSRAAPYINHPLSLVRLLVVEAGIDDPVILAASHLHDVLEDTVESPKERQELEEVLRQRFGPEVLGIVLEMTDDKALPKDVRKRLQVEHAPDASVKARAAKLGDKIVNLRDIANDPPQGWSLQRQQEYFDWAAAVVDGLRGHWPRLEALFDDAFKLRPV